MSTAFFRFYAELNDFLPRRCRQREFVVPLDGSPAVKHVIEALGAPHPEVDLILVNGQAVDFTYHLQDGDRVSVYPVFETFDITPLNRLRPHPLRQPRFVLDGHLGRLAAYLRMLGFDTLYTPDAEDERLARLASDEKRILLTRDRGLLKRNLVARGYCVRQDDPHAQVMEIVERFDLRSASAPFTRCLRCNGLLEAVNKTDVIQQLQLNTLQFYNEFHRCTLCGQVYWKGSHYQRMQRLLLELNIP
jgi:hypothetical protein